MDYEDNDPVIKIIQWIVDQYYSDNRIVITANSLSDIGHIKLIKEAWLNFHTIQLSADDLVWIGNKYPLLSDIINKLDLPDW